MKYVAIALENKLLNERERSYPIPTIHGTIYAPKSKCSVHSTVEGDGTTLVIVPEWVFVKAEINPVYVGECAYEPTNRYLYTYEI